MTAHYRPHRSLWGSSHRLWGSGLPHKAQQAAPQALRYWPILFIIGVGTKGAHHTSTAKGITKSRQSHTTTAAGQSTILGHVQLPQVVSRGVHPGCRTGHPKRPARGATRQIVTHRGESRSAAVSTVRPQCTPRAWDGPCTASLSLSACDL